MYTATDSNRQTENFKSIDYRLTAKEESMKFYYYSELNRQKSNEAQKVVYLVWMFPMNSLGCLDCIN